MNVSLMLIGSASRGARAKETMTHIRV